MRYPQEIVDEVRLGNDIVDVIGGYVTLKNRGGNFFGICPFHNEKTPSFSVSPDKQIYYCFGCGAGGNVLSFIMQIENYDFLDAFKFLAGRINYILPTPVQSESAKQKQKTRDTIREINKKAAHFFYEYLQSNTEEAEEARRYLSSRGISKLQKRFGLGLAPDSWEKLLLFLQNNGFNLEDMVESGLVKSNQKGRYYDRFRGRLMFPIMDINGDVVGFGGRIMKDDDNAAKYLNSPETILFDKSRQLYGIHATRKSRPSEVIMVEGYMDVISLHLAGFVQAMGVLGTALTPHHGRLLKRMNVSSVVLLFDRDRAGVKAVLRAIPILLEVGLKVKCLQVTEDAKDPDGYIQKYGSARFGQLLEGAKSHIAFRIDLLMKEYDLKNTEQRINFTKEAATMLAGIDNAIEADAYIHETSLLTGIASDAILAEMNKQRGRYFSAHAAPRQHTMLRHNLKGRQAERGLIEARKGLLAVIVSNPSLAEKIESFLTPEEVGDEVEAKLLKYIYTNAGRSADTIVLADIISWFETLEEQQKVAEILKDTPNFENDIAMEKAINEMWRIIKRASYEKEMMEEQQKIGQDEYEIDLNMINTLGLAIRNLEKQYITVTNG